MPITLSPEAFLIAAGKYDVASLPYCDVKASNCFPIDHGVVYVREDPFMRLTLPCRIKELLSSCLATLRGGFAPCCKEARQEKGPLEKEPPQVGISAYSDGICDGTTLLVMPSHVYALDNLFVVTENFVYGAANQKPQTSTVVGWTGEPNWPDADMLVQDGTLIPTKTSFVDAMRECPLELVDIIESYVPNGLCNGTVAYCKLMRFHPNAPMYRACDVRQKHCMTRVDLFRMDEQPMPSGYHEGATRVVKVTDFKCEDRPRCDDADTNNDGRIENFANHVVQWGCNGYIYVTRRSDGYWCKVKNTEPFLKLI
jgi:hypothetical protein